jgi:AcrR family transcriptional regulator
MAREVPATPRKEPRQERARATVDSILVAAAHILKTEGFERATTNRIAELAGVSIGSLYQYFPNKESVVGALRERHTDWFEGCLRAEIGRIVHLPLRPAARAAVDLVIALHAVDPELHNALSERRATDPHDELEFRHLMQAQLEANRDELRPLDAELASFIAVRALEAVVHGTALDEPERLSDPRFADEVTELLVRYLSRGESC